MQGEIPSLELTNALLEVQEKVSVENAEWEHDDKDVEKSEFQKKRDNHYSHMAKHVPSHKVVATDE